MVWLMVSLAWAGEIEFTWQARVLDAQGLPIQGTTSVTASIWQDEAQTPPALWTDTFTGVPADDGFVTVVLGSDEPLTQEDLPSAGAWLDIVVGGAADLPVQRIRPVPYAAQALSVAFDTTTTCDATSAGRFRRAAGAVDLCDGSNWLRIGRVANDGASAGTAASSCYALHEDFPSLTSGTYYIDPAGTGAFEAWCDMESNGGGWTLVGNWAGRTGYAMADYASEGLYPDEVRSSYTTVRSAGTSPGQGPTHYSSAVINALFQEGPAQYMTLTGRSSSGFILTNLTKVGSPIGFDAYRGVYDTKYTEDSGFLAQYEQSTTNVFVLPRSNAPGSTATFNARTCSTSDCFHYLPDDLTGGGQWLFRENFDDVPTTAYSSSNVPSLLLIR